MFSGHFVAVETSCKFTADLSALTDLLLMFASNGHRETLSLMWSRAFCHLINISSTFTFHSSTCTFIFLAVKCALLSIILLRAYACLVPGRWCAVTYCGSCWRWGGWWLMTWQNSKFEKINNKKPPPKHSWEHLQSQVMVLCSLQRHTPFLLNWFQWSSWFSLSICTS